MIDKLIWLLIRWRIKYYIKQLNKEGIMKLTCDIQGFSFNLKITGLENGGSVTTTTHTDKDNNLVQKSVMDTTKSVPGKFDLSLDIKQDSFKTDEEINGEELQALLDSADHQMDKAIDGFIKPTLDKIVELGGAIIVAQSQKKEEPVK